MYILFLIRDLDIEMHAIVHAESETSVCRSSLLTPHPIFYFFRKFPGSQGSLYSLKVETE